MPLASRPSTGNRLLDALSDAQIGRLGRDLEAVSLPLKQVLYRPQEEIKFLYFPVKGLVSVASALKDGSTIEIGTVGREGLVGVPALIGNGISFHHVVVQGAGSGLRARPDALQREFDRSGLFRETVLRFLELFLAQISQTALCNRHHTLEERCARWFLTLQDRLDTNHFPLTQEFLAMLLGTRRAGVSAVALGLQHRGAIRYRHGRIDILDRKELEAAACECYRVNKVRIDGFLRS